MSNYILHLFCVLFLLEVILRLASHLVYIVRTKRAKVFFYYTLDSVALLAI